MKTEQISALAGYYLAVLERLHAESSSYLVDITAQDVESVDVSLFTDVEVLLRTELMEVAEPPDISDADESVQARLFERDDEERDDGVDLPQASATSQERRVAFGAMRRLLQRLELNPYEREAVYAYPLIVGTSTTGRKIRAPVFTTKCRLVHDLTTNTIKVHLATDELVLNDAVWRHILPDSALQYFLGQKLEQCCPDIPLEESELLEFLGKLRSATTTDLALPLQEASRLTRLHGFPRQSEGVTVVPSALLLVVPRPLYYVRKDLAALRDGGVDPGHTVLDRLGDFTEPSDAVAETTEGVGTSSEELVFPFVSNEAQRRVAGSIRDGELVEVQGPPGTGKSLTICNLVTHLVAAGKTVLVTSQKNKALEVVASKLSELDTEYLFMPLLKDDSESKRALLRKLSAIDSHLQLHVGRGFDSRCKQAEEAKMDAMQRLVAAREEFDTARRHEHEMAETYREYHASRPHVLFSEDIVVPEGDAASLAETCLEYAHTFVAASAGYQPGSWWDVISSWAARLPDISKDPGPLVGRIETIAAQLENMGKLSAKPSVTDSCLRMLADVTVQRSEMATMGELLRSLRPRAIRAADDLRRLASEQPSATAMVSADGSLAALSSETRGLMAMDISVLSAAVEEVRLSTSAQWYNLRAKLRGWFAANRAKGLVRRLPKEFDPRRISDLVAEAAWMDVQVALERLARIVELAGTVSEIRADVLKLRDAVFKWNDSASPETVAASIDNALAALELGTLSSCVSLSTSTLGPIAAAYGLHVELAALKEEELLKKAAELRRIARTLIPFAHLKSMEPLLGEGLAGWLRARCCQSPSTEALAADALSKAITAHRLALVLKDDLATAPADTREAAASRTSAGAAVRSSSGDVLRARTDARLRRECSKRLVGQEVATLRRALRAGRRSHRSFERLKESVDYERVLQVLPCWVMGIDDVSRTFPLVAGLFDVVIVDEASQCHLMGALPLLYRARAAVVVGDTEQLPNAEVTWLPAAANLQLKQRFGVDALPRGFAFDAADSSLLDMVSVWRDTKVFLNEHFRSLPEIIRFSNERFYAAQLRVMTHGCHAPPGGPFEIVHVKNATENDDQINEAEGRALAKDLVSRLKDPAYGKLSFGVLSLYREQAAFLQRLVADAILKDPVIAARQDRDPLIVSTVDGFQGDERDVIFYSFRFAQNSHRGVVTAIQMGRPGQCRINVAFTRARRKVVCYVSRDIAEFPAGLVRDFLAYARNPLDGLPARPQVFDSSLEEDVYGYLTKRELTVHPQYPACGFHIDLVASDNCGRRLAIECDGRFHYEADGRLRLEDLERQEILERAGWSVLRIPSRRFWADPDRCADEVVAVLGSLPVPEP
jgi:very-short-patch-repair endonuclease